MDSQEPPRSTGEVRGSVRLSGGFRAALSGMPWRERWAWIVIASGFVLLLWGVLHLTTATIGGPIHELKDRRTYTQVKQAAHQALPVTLLLGFAGGALLVLGRRLRASAERSRTQP